MSEFFHCNFDILESSIAIEHLSFFHIVLLFLIFNIFFFFCKIQNPFTGFCIFHRLVFRFDLLLNSYIIILYSALDVKSFHNKILGIERQGFGEGLRGKGWIYLVIVILEIVLFNFAKLLKAVNRSKLSSIGLMKA